MSKSGASSKKILEWFTSLKAWVKDTGRQLFIAIILVLIIRSSLVEPYKIPSGSMIPSLFIGDHIFVNKMSYGLKVPFGEFFLDRPVFITEPEVPARGDIIVFRYPRNKAINYIKRVIGLPRDTIEIRGKTLFINDQKIEDTPYEDEKLMDGIENKNDREELKLFLSTMNSTKYPVLYDRNNLSNLDWGPYEVPEGSLFVMGDNRDRSSDSRFWGFVPLENVKGQALFVWLNLSFKWKDQPKIKFRPNRIGSLVH